MSLINNLLSGTTGLKGFQTKLDVIGNNISNVSSIGFKKGQTTFLESFQEQFKTAMENNNSTLQPQTKGFGIVRPHVSIDTYSPAVYQETNRGLDIAVRGDGYLIFEQNGKQLYSRDGAMGADTDGNIVLLSTGAYLLGWSAKWNNDGQTGIDHNGPLERIKLESLQHMDHKASSEMFFSGNLNSGAPVRHIEALKKSFGVEDADGNFYNMEYDIEKQTHNSYLFHFRGNNEDLFTLNAIIDDYGQLTWKTGAAQTENITENTDTNGKISLNWQVPHKDPELSLQMKLELPTQLKKDSLGDTIEPVLTTSILNKPAHEADNKYFLSSVLKKGEKVQAISGVIDSGGQQHNILTNFEHVEKNDGRNVWKYSLGLGENDPLILAWLASEHNESEFNGPVSADDLQRANDAIFGPERTGLLRFDENGFATNQEQLKELNTRIISSVTDQNSLIRFNFDFSSVTAFSATTGLDAPKNNGYPAGELRMSSVTSDGNGYLKGVYTNGEERYLGLFGLAVFKNGAGLLRENNNMFALGENAGFDETSIGKPNSATHGLVLPGFLEQSNVNLIDEFTELIITQRMFQANSKAINISDQSLNTAIQMKR